MRRTSPRAHGIIRALARHKVFWRGLPSSKQLPQMEDIHASVKVRKFGTMNVSKPQGYRLRMGMRRGGSAAFPQMKGQGGQARNRTPIRHKGRGGTKEGISRSPWRGSVFPMRGESASEGFRPPPRFHAAAIGNGKINMPFEKARGASNFEPLKTSSTGCSRGKSCRFEKCRPRNARY